MVFNLSHFYNSLSNYASFCLTAQNGCPPDLKELWPLDELGKAFNAASSPDRTKTHMVVSETGGATCGHCFRVIRTISIFVIIILCTLDIHYLMFCSTRWLPLKIVNTLMWPFECGNGTTLTLQRAGM